MTQLFQKPTQPAPEPHPEFMDLSFSTSFGGDDFMSAVDKLERDYGNTKTNAATGSENKTKIADTKVVDNNAKVVTNSSNTKRTCVSSVQNVNNSNSDACASKPKVSDTASTDLNTAESSNNSRQGVPLTFNFSNRHNVELKEDQALTLKTKLAVEKIDTNCKTIICNNNDNSQSDTENIPKVRACQLKTESKENIKSTPKSEVSRRKPRISITSSFLMSPDISFTSPQGVSTPQITPKGNRNEQKRIGHFSKPGISAIVKSKNETKKREGKVPVNKKDSIEVTPVRTKDITNSNKRDFFKSLFMDKSSDISVSPDVTDKILVDKTPELVDSASAEKADENKTLSKAENRIQHVHRKDVQASSKKNETSSNMKSSNDSTENNKERTQKMTVLAEGSRDNINDAEMKPDMTEDKKTEREGNRGSDPVEFDKTKADLARNEHYEEHTSHGSTIEPEKVVHSNIGNFLVLLYMNKRNEVNMSFSLIN